MSASNAHNSDIAEQHPHRSSAGKVLVIQHNADNGPGIVTKIPLPTFVHRSDLDPVMPSLDGALGLIVLGGPQASYSDSGFPSRRAELELLKNALAEDVPVLGICLGAQLLAVALGARTYKREIPEIGYLPVALTEEGVGDPLFSGCPATFVPRQRHYDSFELPADSTRLASSDLCQEQGYRFGNHAWGLQFHFEMDPATYPLAQTDTDVAASLTALEPTAQRILLNFCSVVEANARNRIRTAS